MKQDRKTAIIGVPRLLGMFMVIVLFCCSCSNKRKNLDAQNEVVPHEPEYLLGICIDSMKVVHDVVQPNEFLSTLLSERGVSTQVIDHLAHDTVFDVSTIRSGNEYTMLLSNDKEHTPLFWIYEIDNRNFAIFSLTDSLKSWRFQKDLNVVVDRTKGTITSSLWSAVIDNGGDPELAVRLSEIYAWTIDFFDIQDGDAFDVAYERQYVDEESVGLGKIFFCNFVHCGDTLRAISFEQDGKTEYFDEKGTNLRKAFLKAPLNFSRISSTFSNSRFHPVLKYYRPHHGVDYAAPSGTPVHSIGDGVVITKAYQRGGGGNYLKIKHNETYTTCYMHLKGYAKGISQGSRVKQGQLIGYVGSTGIATGPHLDFRVYKNGTPIDPLKMQSPPANPISAANSAQFKKEADYWMKAMSKSGVPGPYTEVQPDTLLLADPLNLVADSLGGSQ